MKKKYASQYISKEKADEINDKDSEENASVESPIINLEAQQSKNGLTVHAEDYSAGLVPKAQFSLVTPFQPNTSVVSNKINSPGLSKTVKIGGI